MRFGQIFLAILVAAACVLAAGCRGEAPRAPRRIGGEVLGALTPDALRETYHTPAFVVRGREDGRHVAMRDTDLASDSRIDDTNLLIFVEGAGDAVDGFRWTARLLAESPYDLGAADRLVVIYLKWCQSAMAVAEHMNRQAQQAGAAVLADMLEVHRVRHGSGGRVSIVGFSAGTRVIEMAFQGAESGDAAWHPEAFPRVDHVVFLGSSLGSEESMPFGMIHGRFINFVNLRDTHFGDRAAYVAPAGQSANLLKLLQQGTIQRRPRFGASVAGFLGMPTLTGPEQFDALDALARSGAPAAAQRAFRMVNVPVPPMLVPYSLFGQAIPNDDLDDYLNQAPNHYILVGRGPAGRTDVVDFKQYRATAEEFVREHVGAAAMRGRLYRFDLKAVPKGASPLGLPLPVPWAIFSPTQKAPDEPGGTTEPPPPPPAEPGAPAP